MCEPLRNKGIIDDITRAYLELKWFKEDGREYKSDHINFDGDYNAFTPDGEPLYGKYFDEDGSEVKHTVFPVGAVKSAVEFYKKYKNTRFEFMTNYPKEYEKYLKSVGREHYKNNDVYNDWLFNYCFGDVIDGI